MRYRLATDNAFHVKAAVYGKKFVHLGFPLVHYDCTGVSSKKFAAYKAEMKQAYEDLVPEGLRKIVMEHEQLRNQSQQTIVKKAIQINNWYQQTWFARKRKGAH